MLFIHDIKFFEHYFLGILANKCQPIKLDDLIENTPSKRYNNSFYLGFLNNIFNNVPFWGFNPKNNQNFALLKKDLRKVVNNSFNLKLDTYLKEKSVEEKIDIINVICLSEFWFNKNGDIDSSKSYLQLNNKNGEIIINKRKLSPEPFIIAVLNESDHSLSLDEIGDALESNNAFKKKISKQSMFSILLRNINIIRLDKYKWGLKKHIHYDENEYPNVHQSCIKFLKKINHQSSASVIYENIKKSFKKLCSKYELVIIMRDCVEIDDLGFFNFGLSEWNLGGRVKVSEIITDLFSNNSNPKSKIEIMKAISSVRTFMEEGLPNVMKQLGYINYPPGYYGLNNLHENNLQLLFNNISYFEKYIKYQLFDTSLESIRDYFLFPNDHEIADKIDLLKNMLIVKDPYSTNRFVIRKIGSNRRLYDNEIRSIVRTVLFNSSKPLTIEELKYFCVMSPSQDKDNWYHLQSTLDRKILKIVQSDKRYKVLSNGAILFTGETDLNSELVIIKEEAINYVESLNKSIDLSTLFSLVNELSEALNTEDELRYLLETDDRILINNDYVELN